MTAAEQALTVVHVVCSNAFAGVEGHVAQLAAAQAAAGHTVRVVGGDPVRMREVLDPAAVDHRPGSSVATATREAVRLLRAGRVSVLHAHMTDAETAAVLARAATRVRVPIVATRHFAARRGSTLLRRWWTHRLGRRIDAQIAISHAVAAEIEGSSTVVHPGVPVRPDSAPAEARDRVVLVVQRLEAEKRTDLAVDAFARSGLADRGWRLVVAGGGSLAATLTAQSDDLGLDGAVELLGHRSDVEALMARAGVLLAPCPVEGLGLAVLEAMSAGLPVVAAAAAGHLETVGAVAPELVYPPAEIDAAAGVLVKLADDLAARTSYGKALQEAQRHDFTLAAQVRGTDAVYRSLR